MAATVFLLVWYKPFDWRELSGHLRTAAPGWLAAAVAAEAATIALWVAQWHCLLPVGQKIPVRRLAEIVALTGAAVNTVPYLGGHAIGLGLLMGRGSLDVAAASSLLAVDQVCRGVVKVLLVCVALLVVPVPEALRFPIVALSAGVPLLFAILLTLAWLPARLGETWRGMRWLRALDAMRRPTVLASGAALVALMKVCNAVTIYCVQRGMGVELPLAGIVLALLAINLAGLIQLTPGNIGLFEAAAVLAYRCLGVDFELAVAMALVLHACALVPTLAAGYSVLAWRTLTARQKA